MAWLYGEAIIRATTPVVAYLARIAVHTILMRVGLPAGRRRLAAVMPFRSAGRMRWLSPVSFCLLFTAWRDSAAFKRSDFCRVHHMMMKDCTQNRGSPASDSKCHWP